MNHYSVPDTRHKGYQYGKRNDTLFLVLYIKDCCQIFKVIPFFQIDRIFHIVENLNSRRQAGRQATVVSI